MKRIFTILMACALTTTCLPINQVQCRSWYSLHKERVQGRLL